MDWISCIKQNRNSPIILMGDIISRIGRINRKLLIMIDFLQKEGLILLSNNSVVLYICIMDVMQLTLCSPIGNKQKSKVGMLYSFTSGKSRMECGLLQPVCVLVMSNQNSFCVSHSSSIVNSH